MAEEARQPEPPAFLRKEEHREPVREAAPVRLEAAPVREEAPRIDPKELLDNAGLVMIETDRSKAAPPVPQEEPVNLGRPRRERPKPQQPQEEELQQVETKR